MSLPTFVVIGAQKSGTTTLHRMLGEHPQIFRSRPKELHFFDRHYDRGFEWYTAQFSPGPQQAASCETCGAYMFDPRARERMVHDLPDTRFVAVLREPVSRAYSHYWMNRLKDSEPVGTFEEAVRIEPERSRESRIKRIRFGYVRRGRYIRDLRWFTDAVGRERLHVFCMDELLTDPAATLRDLFDFVGVDAGFSDSVELLHSKPGAAPTRRSIFGRRPAPAYPPIDPATRAQLRAAYRDDNVALSRWLGRPLPPGWVD